MAELIIKIKETSKGFIVNADVSGNLVQRMGMVKLAEMHLLNMKVHNRKEFDSEINIKENKKAKEEADKLPIRMTK